MGSLMPSHLLSNFELEKHYYNKPRFNGDFSENNGLKEKDRAYVISLD